MLCCGGWGWGRSQFGLELTLGTCPVFWHQKNFFTHKRLCSNSLDINYLKNYTKK